MMDIDLESTVSRDCESTRIPMKKGRMEQRGTWNVGERESERARDTQSDRGRARPCCAPAPTNHTMVRITWNLLLLLTDSGVGCVPIFSSDLLDSNTW